MLLGRKDRRSVPGASESRTTAFEIRSGTQVGQVSAARARDGGRGLESKRHHRNGAPGRIGGAFDHAVRAGPVRLTNGQIVMTRGLPGGLSADTTSKA